MEAQAQAYAADFTSQIPVILGPQGTGCMNSGGGAEWAIAQGWTFKAEYLRIGFGSLTTMGLIYPVQVPADANPFTSTANLTANLFRVGLNHRF